MMQKKLAYSDTTGSTQRVGILAFVMFLAIWSLGFPTMTYFFDFSHLHFPFSLPQNFKNVTRDESRFDWVSVKLEENYTSRFLSRLLAPGGEPCKDSKTVQIKFLNFEDRKSVVLSTAKAYEVFFQTLNKSGHSRCRGGDYFEVDLSGEFWKSRPPTKDLGNGKYSFILQVHPDFSGTYNLTIIMLFRNFEGIKYDPGHIYRDTQYRKIPITFSSNSQNKTLPKLHLCKKSDFSRDVWAGRWTRHAKNDSCKINNEGRYMCLEPDYPCTKPWCDGSLGSLDSNGWVYSTHCSFRLFSVNDAWNCLNNRWIFLWGDSNHVDTIRNMLFFNLGIPLKDLVVVARSFDKKFTNPKNNSFSVRITNVYNGHWNDSTHNLGLRSLSNKGYRGFLKSFFNGSTVPDTIIFNSGLHDANFNYWGSVEKFVLAVKYATSFWKEIIEEVEKKGLNVPNIIFRSTVAAGGYARKLSYNPSKIEAFNGILLEHLRKAGLVNSVIDDFDMKWAWHFDNRCSDGIHYGRFRREGIIEHQYFVDLMLAHVLLNTICPI